MGPTFSQLTSLSFHVNRASNSWVTTFPKFDLENQRSRSWVRSKLKVTTWVQHSIDSHPFRFMWIRHPTPELQHFQNLTLKIRVKGHGWGHSSKSQCGSNILSTHIPFILCETGIPFLSYDFFENLTLKIKGQGHGWGHSSKSQCGSNILSIHIPFVPCQSISKIQYFHNLTLKIKGQGHMTMMWHNYRSRQFHRTSNGTDPSRGFRDMGSTKSGPSAASFDKFLAHGQAHIGQMGK